MHVRYGKSACGWQGNGQERGEIMRKVLSVMFSAMLVAGAVGVAACSSNSYEGSGSKSAATAEQLAQKTDDPWDATQSVTNSELQGNYKDGTYTGEGQGMDGWIRVTITISGNRLSVDSITQEGETQSVGGYEAIENGTFAEQIDAAQGTGIDGVSGATITSSGVIAALQDALDQAAA